MRLRPPRHPPTTYAVARSDLMRSDPGLAGTVDLGLREHYTKNTGSTYRTGANDYSRFCENRALRPWPVDEITYCGWLHVTARRIKISSMAMYMAGVRDASILAGYPWHLRGNEMVRRTMRYLKRRHPITPKAAKMPITVAVLRRILPLLHEWPDMARMTADDRVFASASVSAVAGFLRGGEFLTSRGSTRATLKASDVVVRRVNGCKAQVIGIPQPKAKFWLSTQSVPCYASTPDNTFCPVRLWGEYSRRCPGFTASGPAFLLQNKALTREYMVTRTNDLMRLANISLHDHTGTAMNVQAASWRSGAVCSAIAANVSVPYIMLLGRWSSSAWENYIVRAPIDLRRPAHSMWSGVGLQAIPTTKGLRVAEFDVGAFLEPSLIASITADLSILNI